MRRTTAEHKTLARAMSLDRSPGRRSGKASHRRASLLPQEQSAGLALAVANPGKHLRRSRGVDGNARLGDLNGGPPQGVDGGVRPVRDPVAAHALGERPTRDDEGNGHKHSDPATIAARPVSSFATFAFPTISRQPARVQLVPCRRKPDDGDAGGGDQHVPSRLRRTAVGVLPVDAQRSAQDVRPVPRPPASITQALEAAASSK